MTARAASRWSLWSQDSVLSIASRGSVLSIGSVGSCASIGSVGSFASSCSIGSAMSFLSIGSFQSSGSVLSGQSNRSVLSWQSILAVMGRRERGALRGTSGVVVAGIAVTTAAALTAVLVPALRRTAGPARPDRRFDPEAHALR